MISGLGLATDPAKVQAIQDWPTPSFVRDLRGFLGLAGYYRKFVHHFGVITKPLTDLLKKDSLFVWTSIHESAFLTLKAALSSAPVLALPDFPSLLRSKLMLLEWVWVQFCSSEDTLWDISVRPLGLAIRVCRSRKRVLGNSYGRG